jgi:rhodanese-related sulfurtransferase
MPQRTAAPCSSTSAPSASGRPTAQSPERGASLATCSSGGLDPSSGHQDPSVGGLDRHVVLMCNEGYQSSLAAATLQTLGFARATDVVGGFQAWRDAGLPVVPA